MNKARRNRNPFLNSYVISSIGTLVMVILIAFYIARKSETYREIDYNNAVTESRFYDLAGSPSWHKIDVSVFSIETPKSYLYSRLRGVDSKIGQIANQRDTILFDYGLYSWDFADEIKHGNSVSCTTRIDGRLFTVIRSKDDSGMVGAYTNDLPDEQPLSIFCHNCTCQDSLLRIFETIKFR